MESEREENRREENIREQKRREEKRTKRREGRRNEEKRGEGERSRRVCLFSKECSVVVEIPVVEGQTHRLVDLLQRGPSLFHHWDHLPLLGDKRSQSDERKRE